jgi:hypothetical protein
VIKRKPIVITIMVLALAMITTAATFTIANQQSAAPEQHDLAQVKEDLVRRRLDANGFVIDPNQIAGEISARYPGGYGGYYFSEDGQTVYAYMLDPTQQSAAEAAVRAAHGKPLDGVMNIVPVQGRYSMQQLADWYRPLKRQLKEDSVYPTMSAIRETNNRIRLGFRELEAKRATIERVIAELGIPLDAVELEENFITPFLDDSVQAEWDDVPGGVQYEINDTGLFCSVGFITERDDVEGLVTASHCAVNNNPTPTPVVGGNQGTEYWQNNSATGDIIADEAVDPTPRSGLGGCDSGTCKYADAAYATRRGSEPLARGYIADTVDYGDTDVNPSGDTYWITAEVTPSLDDDLILVGRSSGKVRFEVIDTCFDFELLGVEIVCVMLGEYTNAEQAIIGDSGGSVIEVVSGDEVNLAGIFTGEDEFGNLAFNPVGNVYLELGVFETWDSCLPAQGC